MLAELGTYDWQQAFGYAGEPGTYATGGTRVEAVHGSSVSAATFTREDVAEILCLIDGENDGAEWVGVFRLRDGRYASLMAGCDYTGWDCQAGGNAFVAERMSEIATLGLTDDQRRRILGEEPRVLNQTFRGMVLAAADGI
jgi:hypothetical protein